MIAHVLQPWVTLLVKSLDTVRQSDDRWLELAGFRDVCAWIQVSEVTSVALALRLEGSPTEDESLFGTLATRVVSSPGLYLLQSRAIDIAPVPVTATIAVPPVTRFVRWAVVPGSSGDYGITFRVVVCANPCVPDFKMICGGEVFTNPALGGP